MPDRSDSARSRPRFLARRAFWKGCLVAVATVAGLFVAVASVLYYFFGADPEGRIRITDPEDGTVVNVAAVLVQGTSSPDWAGVYTVIDGNRVEVPVDDDGDWRYRVLLTEGPNILEFRLGSGYRQSDRITIVFNDD
jgi:hypothetical protein